MQADDRRDDNDEDVHTTGKKDPRTMTASRSKTRAPHRTEPEDDRDDDRRDDYGAGDGNHAANNELRIKNNQFNNI